VAAAVPSESSTSAAATRRQNTEFIAAHVDEYIHACLDAHIVGCGDELAIRGQAHLPGARHNPLDVGGGKIVAQPDGARSQPGSFGELAECVLWVSSARRAPSLSLSAHSGRLANRLQLSVEPTVSIG